MLTLDAIRQAYKETGLRPVQWAFFSQRDDGMSYACPLGALAIARGEPIIISGTINEEINRLAGVLGLTTKEAYALVLGWDNPQGECPKYSDPAAFLLGQQAYRLMIAESR